jgi:hypothetical protein
MLDIARLSVVFAAAQLFAVFWALKTYERQAEEASKSRMLDATRLLIEELGDPDVRRIRSWLLDECKDPVPADIDKETEAKVRTLIVAYDRVGLIIKQKLILDSTLYEFQQDEIGQVWRKAKPVIDRIRQGPRTNYAHHFEDLALKWLPEARKKYGT